ncbi:Laccase 1 [Operophtera brumata]|uniref:Laccase 1 n=1 Tax=Operophtera brumata TaxID=104452 RepID=A0A0L7LNX4_OPEBR|nr:Laccase 1 [Operophtera brumata]
MYQATITLAYGSYQRGIPTAWYPYSEFEISNPSLFATIVDPGLDSIGMPRDGKNHPCYRECNATTPVKACYYRFHVEWYYSMSKACKECPYNATHCGYPDCVPANGIGRPITVVNRKMPGPSIQKETPFMDGAPFVTQCPIQPESTFRYEFSTPQSGTFFWHSHIGLQRGDGTNGALIIREPKLNSSHGLLYDIDSSEQVIMVSDWLNNGAINLFTDHHHSSGGNSPEALLINGRGRFRGTFHTMTGQKRNFLLFKVKCFIRALRITTIENNNRELLLTVLPWLKSVLYFQGKRYRFRLINANFLNCPVEFSVDGHNITVIASDGYDLVLNAVQEGEEQNVTIPVSRMTSLVADDASLKPVPDHKFYVGYDMYLLNNTHYHRVPYYGTNNVSDIFWLYTPQLNHISMKLPKSPLLVSRPSSAGFCNESTVNATCQREYCECTHVLNVKVNSIVELIMYDKGNYDTNHPLHLHGHSFRVVGQRRLGATTTDAAIRALDQAGGINRKLSRAPLKDTVTIPDGGYTVIRFIANNPGYWLFHCHIEFHAEIGMDLVFKVGEHADMKPVPAGFPQCGDYKSSNYTIV